MTAAAFLARPMVEWRAAVESLLQTEQAELARELDSIAIRATRAAVYVDHRFGQDAHEKAVKHSNIAAGRTRRALGYTIVRVDVVF